MGECNVFQSFRYLYASRFGRAQRQHAREHCHKVNMICVNASINDDGFFSVFKIAFCEIEMGKAHSIIARAHSQAIGSVLSPSAV